MELLGILNTLFCSSGKNIISLPVFAVLLVHQQCDQCNFFLFQCWGCAGQLVTGAKKWNGAQDRRYCFHQRERAVEGKSRICLGISFYSPLDMSCLCAFIPLQHCYILQYWDYFHTNATSHLQLAAWNMLFFWMNAESRYLEMPEHTAVKLILPGKDAFCYQSVTSSIIVHAHHIWLFVSDWGDHNNKKREICSWVVSIFIDVSYSMNIKFFGRNLGCSKEVP